MNYVNNLTHAWSWRFPSLFRRSRPNVSRRSRSCWWPVARCSPKTGPCLAVTPKATVKFITRTTRCQCLKLCSSSLTQRQNKHERFYYFKKFSSSLKRRERQEPSPVEYHKMPLYSKSHSQRLYQPPKNLTKTKTLAYFSAASVTKKKVFQHWLQESSISGNMMPGFGGMVSLNLRHYITLA